MKENHEQNFDKLKLKIPPLEIPTKTVMVPISKIKSRKNLDKSFSIQKGIVAYIDIMGFSNKFDDKDIETSLLDFSGGLVLASSRLPKVRFNVFSDCAFIATTLENATDLLSGLRFAFSQWIRDGILVRGGLALGTYQETYTFSRGMPLENYFGHLFAGSALTEAVKLEGSGSGSLLFTNSECAEFIGKNHNEPIFLLNNHKIIGWADDDSTLYWFTGISFIRLLRFLSLKDGIKHPVTKKLINNVLYCLSATNSLMPRFVILAILSSSIASKEIKKKSMKIFNIKYPDDFIPFKKLIDDFLMTEKLEILKNLSDSDSSIPNVK
jgi:hypothetical protein